LFENTPLARRLWTGLDDEHLASIGFVNFAWNALERKFSSLVWVAGGWTQEMGEVVIASMGNISLVTLFINLLKQELKKRDDRRIWRQGSQTGLLFDDIRAARNDVIHCFFLCDPTTGVEGYFKPSARKSTSGEAELRTVAMDRSDIDELCLAISDCYESIDDLILKIWFRRRLLGGAPNASEEAYDKAVHGWQDPPFDMSRLRSYREKCAKAARRSDAKAGDGRSAETQSAKAKPIVDPSNPPLTEGGSTSAGKALHPTTAASDSF